MFLIVSVLLAVGGANGAQAQRGGPWQYFPETGHNVSGEFWVYYQGVPNASLVFGAPITEQFMDAASGREVQYFQRARFELHPENPPSQRVALTDLGPFIYERTPVKASVSGANRIGCRFFAATGNSLCYAFLELFDRSGGEAVFGAPISPFVFYNDRIVQFFERARFDYYPEYPEGQKVVIAQVGRILFDLLHEDARRLEPVVAENLPDDVVAIRAHAFTWKATARNNDRQAVYVVVQDQTLKPVSGATVVITIRWAQGGEQSTARTSSSGGVVILPLQVQGQPQGSLILVEAQVLYQGLTAREITSFRIWH